MNTTPLNQLLLTALLLAAVTPARAQDKTIYGADNRSDFWEVSLPAERAAMPAAVSLFLDSSLADAGDRYDVRAVTLGHESKRFCPGQRFLDQQTGAFCSGTLIGPDLVLTAGHCMGERDQPPSRCGRARFVFGFSVNAPDRQPRSVAKEDVYSCAKVEVYSFGDAGDYSVVRLDRPVRGRRPAGLRKAPVTAGEQVFAIGGPYGLPLKVLEDAQVRSANPARGSFVTDLDASTGNSGGGVFSAADGRLLGVHVASGDPDREYVPLPPYHNLPPGDARVVAGKCQVISIFGSNAGKGKLAYSLAAIPGLSALLGGAPQGAKAVDITLPQINGSTPQPDLSRFGVIP